jgi:hypothetical protein
MQERNRERLDLAARRKEIARLRDEHVARVEELHSLIAKEQSAHDQLGEKDSEVVAALEAAGDEEDASGLSRQIGSAQETARKVEANRHYAKAEARVRVLAEEHEKAEAALAALRDKRVALVQAAKMPIDGLDLGDGGVLYKGLPFEQASSAEQLRVSVAMGLALNPSLKVLLIRDGSLLDDANLATIATMAHDAEAQVWIERVGEGEEVSVVIEEGRVKGVEEAEAE